MHQIPAQCWISKNLASTRYNDGTAIPHVTSADEWISLTSPGYCWFDNDSATYASTNGALYNYYVVADTNNRNVCPVGWDVPTDAEWKILEGTVDSQYGVGHIEWSYMGWRGHDAGKRLKSTDGWFGSGNGTDDFGFTALPAGCRYYTDGSFQHLEIKANIWSSTLYYTTNVLSRQLRFDYDQVNRGDTYKEFGFSVRCIRD